MSIILTSSPEELCKAFYKLRTREDVATLLDLTDYQLRYYLYITPPKSHYVEFKIPKRQGGVRQISAPKDALKLIQAKLNQVLCAVYQPRACVHGFVIGRGIVSNAQRHVNRRYVLNIDLKDFFPSINFGRVRGLFMAAPYSLPSEVATVLAQICCYDNQLPQGAPTSPIVSNILCARLDSQLQHLARECKCIYTRYADDLTFSTNQIRFPPAILRPDFADNEADLGNELHEIITKNGFVVNPSKVRWFRPFQRQEVTGITTNVRLNVDRRYIRQIRAMLHAWQKYGLEAAQSEFADKYDRKRRKRRKVPISLPHVVKGKIDFLGMVRGRDDQIYRRFLVQLKRLAPELVKESVEQLILPLPIAPHTIWTEGKTDWKHLKAALAALKIQGKFRGLDLKFMEKDDPSCRGSKNALNTCKGLSRKLQDDVNVFIFDRDEPDVLKEVMPLDGSDFKDWSNRVYSFALPVPSHRSLTCTQISIELLYMDADVKRANSQGRRLFLSNEFNPDSCRHNTIPQLSAAEKGRLKPPLKVIDDAVFNETSDNVALSKNDFAENILNSEAGFENIDFSGFERVFQVLVNILNSESSRVDSYEHG